MRFPKTITHSVFILLLSIAPYVMGQKSKDGVWTRIKETSFQRSASTDQWIVPEKHTTFKLDVTALKNSLTDVWDEKPHQLGMPYHTIELPTPHGKFARYRIIGSPIMEPQLAAKFPEIKTYRGVGIDDSSASLRMTQTPYGFTAQVIFPDKTYYIDRLFQNNQTQYTCYFKKDYTGTESKKILAKGAIPKAGRATTKCLVGEHHPVKNKHPKVSPSPSETGTRLARSSGATLRNYRIAVAATAEYTAFHSSVSDTDTVKKQKCQAAIVTAINRITGIFERELAIRFTLVANNDQLIYTNSTTDPYSDGDSNQMIDINQSTIDNAIGSANYDIGHVFSTGGGGLAGFGVVCGSNKAEGVTGSTSPIGDSFYVDFVAHEIGHQFGAHHTFNSNEGACGSGNRNASTAYEIGSGSTIMSYAGLCNGDDIQENSSTIFHSNSYDAIRAYVESHSCGTSTATGNSIPTIDAGADYTIPANTPFELTAVGTDADTGDTLTYLWEQRDLGPSTSVNDPDNGSSPLFRVWEPTTSPTRTFPRLTDLITNTTAIGETLPTTNRTMNFRVTVRDNRASGGGVNQDDTQITVDNTAGPFAVTSPNNSGISASGNMTVSWDVANTNNSTIDTTHVNILLSTDGGLTYPTALESATPNDGSENVTLPAINTSTARIKVQAANNVYFDISDNNFAISLPSGPQLSITDSSLTEGDSGSSTMDFTVNLSPEASQTVTVDYATSDGTASAGSDYTSASGQLTFAAGETSKTISITVLGDSTKESNETFYIDLSSATNAPIATARTIGTILNDDFDPPVITSSSSVIGTINIPLNYQITATESPTIYGVTGTLPNGLNLNSTTGLIFGTPTETGNFPLTISATNTAGSGSASITLNIGTDPLANSLDGSNLVWTHAGNSAWTRITGSSPTTYDGIDAARSGNIGDDQESIIETTVTGPDILSFYWKVSSEEGFDYLEFSIDGILQNSITGESGWKQKVVTIPSGSHTLQWKYSKDLSDAAGDDAGYLDQVTLASTLSEPTIFSALILSAAKNQPFSYQILATRSPTSFHATGLPTGLTIDTATGIISGTPTELGTFSLSLSASNDNGTGSVAMTLIVGDLLALSEALDTPPDLFTWIGGGDAPWIAQTSITNDSIDATKSGNISDDQQSILQTTVSGPDILIFSWKVGSEDNYDYLSFSLDETERFLITGNVNWQQKMVSIPSGQHLIRWAYTKDTSDRTLPDSGYLDEVRLLSQSFKITSFTKVENDVQVTFPSETGLKYTLEYSTNLKDWNPAQENISGTGNPITATHTGGTINSLMGKLFYRVTAAMP